MIIEIDEDLNKKLNVINLLLILTLAIFACLAFYNEKLYLLSVLCGVATRVFLNAISHIYFDILKIIVLNNKIFMNLKKFIYSFLLVN
jgi:uncharacterized membrane protein